MFFNKTLAVISLIFLILSNVHAHPFNNHDETGRKLGRSRGGGSRGGGGGGRGGGGRGGSRGGGRGRGGKKNKGSRVENDCTVIPEDPVCPFNREGDPGVWVCRTITNPDNEEETETFSACANPEFRRETDTCGCCPGEDGCPMPCTCPCELDGVVDGGVLVDIMSPFDSDEEDDEPMSGVCLDPEMAYRKVSKNPSVTCSSCNV